MTFFPVSGTIGMLKVSQADLDQFESEYPGIGREIMAFEAATLPGCPHCHSTRTAIVHVGIIARTMTVATATSKFQLVPDGPRPGKFYCSECRRYFDGDLATH